MKLSNCDLEEIWESVSLRCQEIGRRTPLHLRFMRRVFRWALERTWRRL
jgi:hypothetical protein